MRKKLLAVMAIAAALSVLLLALHKPSPANAADDESVKIYTVEDMLAVADNPSGSYILMNDLDMKGVTWPAITFTGTFDGNGHALLNLSITSVSEETRETYDGNRKVYATCFGGLFAILENAEVKNLKLIGVDVSREIEADCFLGTIAGWFSESVIENCEVVGNVRLDITGKMFGVGGIVGYGNGVIRYCKADVTLINIDLDKANRDEQFLGGAVAAGYPDLEGNEVSIAGYISDHGYVHSGGLVGMYIIYPVKVIRDGFINNNKLAGFITFFEDNTDRRAYCKESIGEVMNWYFTNQGNSYNFKRDERKDYSKNLLPHYCENPTYTETVTEPTCEEFGHTTYTCTADGCNYSYKADYTLHKHNLSADCTELISATLEAEGLGEFTCSECGAKVYATLPKLTPTPTPTPSPTPTPEPTATPLPTPTPTAGNSDKSTGDTEKVPVPPVIIILLVVCSAAFLIILGYIIYSIISGRKKR